MVKIEKKFIIIAILLRVLIMPWFYHPDIKTQHFHFQFLKHGVFDIYSYVAENKNKLPNKDTFNYLPLTYFTFGTTNTISSFILGSQFDNWVNDWGEDQNQNTSIPIFMFVLKIPYLICDILIAYLLVKKYQNQKIALIWLFNPITIYLIYILGNFDILPSLLTLLAFLLQQQKKYILSYFSIGIAIALKMYPIMFVPLLLINNPKQIFQQIKFSLFLIIPIFVSALPFMFTGSFTQAFLGSGLTQKIIANRFLGVPLFPAFYLIILFLFFKSKNKFKTEIAFLQLAMIFIGTVDFHAQWLIWFLPMYLVLLSQSKKIKYLIIFNLLISILYIFLLNDNFSFWGHLTPIDYEFINQRSPYQLIQLKTHLNPDSLRNYIHSLIFIISIIISLNYVKKNQ